MKELRIVFMGTPDFAVATLDKLVTANYNVVGVITAPDKPAGRGRKLQQSAVKKYAQENSLTILQPTNLKDEIFLARLKELKGNLNIVVAFRMLPKVVWNMPEYGTFNLHASLLPQYRGAAPINWAIINGEVETGATTFFIDDRIDTGEIILQDRIPIDADETAGELHDRLMLMGSNLVVKTVQEIQKGMVNRIKQETTINLKSAYKIYKHTCEIDWNKPLAQIYNHIRGLSPYPASWTTLYNGNDSVFFKIYLASKEVEEHNQEIGNVVFNKKEIKVAVNGGYIKLLEIQLPGKRKMKTTDVLNGLKLNKNAKMT